LIVLIYPTVPLGDSGGNFNQFRLRQGLSLCPGFPVSFGEFSGIFAWFTFHRRSLYQLIVVYYYLQKPGNVKDRNPDI
jgi:hypothetical protein